MSVRTSPKCWSVQQTHCGWDGPVSTSPSWEDVLLTPGVFMRIMKEGQGCKDQPNFYFHPPSFSITRRQISSFSYLRNVNSPVRVSFCWSNRTTGVTSTQLKVTYLRGFTKIRSRNLEFWSTHLLPSDATLQNSPQKLFPKNQENFQTKTKYIRSRMKCQV